MTEAKVKSQRKKLEKLEDDLVRLAQENQRINFWYSMILRNIFTRHQEYMKRDNGVRSSKQSLEDQ